MTCGLSWSCGVVCLCLCRIVSYASAKRGWIEGRRRIHVLLEYDGSQKWSLHRGVEWRIERTLLTKLV